MTILNNTFLSSLINNSSPYPPQTKVCGGECYIPLSSRIRKGLKILKRELIFLFNLTNNSSLYPPQTLFCGGEHYNISLSLRIKEGYTIYSNNLIRVKSINSSAKLELIRIINALKSNPSYY
jgi:hypothetical protein